MIDPQTQTNLWGALITFLVAAAAFLNDWRARKNAESAVKNATTVKDSLQTHNEMVQREIVQPIQDIKEATNGKLVELSAENERLKANQSGSASTTNQV